MVGKFCPVFPSPFFLFLHQFQIKEQEQKDQNITKEFPKWNFETFSWVFSKKCKNLSFGYLLNKCFRTLKLVSPSFFKHFVFLVLRYYSVSADISVRCCSWFNISNYCLSCYSPPVPIEMRCMPQIQVTWDVLSFFRKVGSGWRK